MPAPAAPSATTLCPLENITVDIERCARCAFRGSGSATCGGADRDAKNDWRWLLRALAT